MHTYLEGNEMKHNMRLSHGGHEQANEDDFPSLDYWDAAKDDVGCAIRSAENMLDTVDFKKIRQFMSGPERSQSIIKLAEMILAQRRFYIEGASQSIVEEMF
jgi:hypothetical protein